MAASRHCRLYTQHILLSPSLSVMLPNCFGGFMSFMTHYVLCLSSPQCRSESSHSDEESSGEEDEDDPMSLSPASSASCHQPPPPLPTDSSAPSCLPASPAQWSVEEVSQFISSLQGWRTFTVKYCTSHPAVFMLRCLHIQIELLMF